MATEICSSISTNESESNMLQEEESSSSCSEKKTGGFGKFLVAAADIIDLKCARRIGVYFCLGESHTESLKSSDDPGLDLLTTMRTRNLITPFNINPLLYCLKEMELSGTAEKMQNLFMGIGCCKNTPSQDVEGLQGLQGLTTEDSNFSATTSSYQDCETSENHTSSESTKKRKIDATDEDQDQPGGKRNARRFNICSGDKYIYVVHEVEKDDKETEIKPDNIDEETDDVTDGNCSNEDHGIQGDQDENKQCREDDEEEEKEGEMGKLVAATLEGDSHSVKMIYISEDRLCKNIEQGQIYKLSGYFANEDRILLTGSTKVMKWGDDELFQGITPEERDRAVTSFRNSPSAINLPSLEVETVKYKLSEKTIVHCVAVVVTKIVLHVAFFNKSFERKVHLTVADSEKDRLTVIVHDKNLLTSRLREGSIIKLLNFETFKGQRSSNYNDSSCLVSRKGSQIKLIKKQNLEKVKELLPLTGSYQMEGKVIGINVLPDSYDACPRPQCHEKKVEMIKEDHFYCKKCGENYMKSKILEGFFLKMSVKNEKTKEYIIFKSTITSTLSELHENTSQLNEELNEVFEKRFFKKLIRMVVKPSDGQFSDVITSIQALQ